MILRGFIVLAVQIFLVSCSKHYAKQKQEFSHYSFPDKTEKASEKDSVLRYKQKVDAETSRQIAVSTGELTKDNAETTLGNFVCDALKYASEKAFKDKKSDLVVVNRGGLRTNLPKGNIKVIHIFELMPFDNEMVLVTVSGKKLMEMLPLIGDKKHPFLGMKIKIAGNKVTSALINGEAIDENKNYTLITSDYLFNGGDNFVFLKDPVEVLYSNIKIRDAIISYCDYLTANNKQLTPYTDGRIEVSK